jgi:hypothetical protein
MSINSISDGEKGSSVRSKINEVIDKINEDFIVLYKTGIDADGSDVDFFPEGYFLEMMYIEETTGNTSSTPNIGDVNSTFFTAPSQIETGSQKSIAVINPSLGTKVTRGSYTYVYLSQSNIFESSNKNLVYSATDWNGSSYDVTFFLRKII